MKQNKVLGHWLTWGGLALIVLGSGVIKLESIPDSSTYLTGGAVVGLIVHFVGLSLRLGSFKPFIGYFVGIIGCGFLALFIIFYALMSALQVLTTGDVSGAFAGGILLSLALVTLAFASLVLLILANVLPFSRARKVNVIAN